MVCEILECRLIMGDDKTFEPNYEYKAKSFSPSRAIFSTALGSLFAKAITKNPISSVLIGAFLGSSSAEVELVDKHLDENSINKINTKIHELNKKKFENTITDDEAEERVRLFALLDQYRYGKEVFGPRLYSYSFLTFKNDDCFWGVKKSASIPGIIACFTAGYYNRTRPFAIGYVSNKLLKFALDTYRDKDDSDKYDDIICLDRQANPKLFFKYPSLTNPEKINYINYSVGNTSYLKP